jgi:hypothetical protein
MHWLCLLLWSREYVDASFVNTQHLTLPYTHSLMQAGNCAWTTYPSWQDAVLSGKKCSTACPVDGTCTTDKQWFEGNEDLKK